MSDNEHVDRHGFEIGQHVAQTLALAGRGGADIDIEHIGREALCREFESGARASGVLEEEIGDRDTSQQRHLLDAAPGNGNETGGRVENGMQMFPAQAFDGEKVAQLAIFRELQRLTGLMGR